MLRAWPRASGVVKDEGELKRAFPAHYATVVELTARDGRTFLRRQRDRARPSRGAAVAGGNLREIQASGAPGRVAGAHRGDDRRGAGTVGRGQRRRLCRPDAHAARCRPSGDRAMAAVQRVGIAGLGNIGRRVARRLDEARFRRPGSPPSRRAISRRPPFSAIGWPAAPRRCALAALCPMRHRDRERHRRGVSRHRAHGPEGRQVLVAAAPRDPELSGVSGARRGLARPGADCERCDPRSGFRSAARPRDGSRWRA